MSDKPSVLFICVGNGGKSQMAAAILRQIAGDAVTVHSAGTAPKGGLNPLSQQVIEEVGATFEGEYPKPIDPKILRTADRVVVLGAEARVEPIDGMRARVETWETDEPSLRGIEGQERMRLVRDDIEARVVALLAEVLPEPAAISG